MEIFECGMKSKRQKPNEDVVGGTLKKYYFAIVWRCDSIRRILHEFEWHEVRYEGLSVGMKPTINDFQFAQEM